MDATGLRGLEHENFIVAMTELAGAIPGSLVRREDGVVVVASGSPIRLFNEVLIADDIGGHDEAATAVVIEAAVATMRERHLRFVVNLRRGTDDRFLGLMARLGLELGPDAEPMPGMALDPIPYAPPQPIDGYEIRAITDSAGLEDHIITASAGFGIPEELVRPIIAADLFRRSGRTVYVGYAGGEPVTTGLGVRTGPVIGVYNIATVESARRRGFGEAMTARVAADGHAAGCEAAILQASPMGRPIYERMGYRTIIEYDGYIEPEPEPDASEPASAEDPATA